MNQVSLVGRLTKDPDLKYTANGAAVANFTLAISRPFQNQQGERETDFINIIVWRKPAENTANYLKKGSLAGVTGRIQTRNYENSEGKRVYVTEVVADSVQFLDSKNSREQSSNQPNQGQTNQQANQNQYNQSQQNQGYQNNQNQQNNQNSNYDPFSNNGGINISDDDLPF